MRYILVLLTFFTYGAFAMGKEQTLDNNLFSFSGIVQWILSTIAVIAIIYILAILIKKSKLSVNKNAPLYIKSCISLSAKHKLFTIKANDKELLVGVAPNNISFIYDLSASKSVDTNILSNVDLNLINSENILYKTKKDNIQKEDPQ